MSDIKINNITDRSGSSGPIFAGISTVSTSAFMVMPSGPTEFRGGRGRGVMLAGSTPSLVKSCDFITIATTGNSESFGDLSAVVGVSGACASSTRSFAFGGDTSPSGGTNSSKIEYVTTSSKGGGNDFGELTVARRYPGGVSDSTRGIANGGTSPTPGVNSNIIDYFTMASTGDASDFGDLILQSTYMSGNNCSSPTRGILAGGHPQLTPIIQFYNIQSKGDSADFGDLTVGRSAVSSGSNATRGVFAGGATPSGTNTIDYITMSTEGNATDFGDLLSATLLYTGAGMYSATRGVHAGTYPASNVLQFITIMSTGNATDFGDLTSGNRVDSANSSDVHGGLG